jgi:hypothetical protein
MIYTPDTITTLDLSRYKRFFAIGCSFTKYWWPSWADVIAHDMNPEFYLNLGKSGAGNPYIFTMLNQLTRKYDLDENDLVAIMWTTFYRDDFYKNGDWLTPGNIYTQGEVPMEFVNNFYSLRGFYLRDLALIDTGMQFLKNQKFDSLAMWGVSPMAQPLYHRPEDQDFNVLDVIDLYTDLDDVILPDLMNTGMNGQWPVYFTYCNPCANDPEIQDYHPCTTAYTHYLQKIGVRLNESTLNFAREIDKETAKIKHVDGFMKRKWHPQDYTAFL